MRGVSRDVRIAIDMNIDREARTKAASLLRRILEGNATNYQFEDEWPSSRSDSALDAIVNMLWFTYDDYPEYKFSEKRFRKEDVEMVQRCEIFLKLDCEYVWPKVNLARLFSMPSPSNWFHRMLKLDKRKAHLLKKKELEIESFKSAGDFEVWPFLRRNDYERELKNVSPVGLGKQP